jgi:hypothetical protein
MTIKIPALLIDRNRVSSVVLVDPHADSVALLERGHIWSLREEYLNWKPLWLLHSAVGKHGFRWLIEPRFDDRGRVTNALEIELRDIADFVNFLEDSSIADCLPESSIDQLSTRWQQWHTSPRSNTTQWFTDEVIKSLYERERRIDEGLFFEMPRVQSLGTEAR